MNKLIVMLSSTLVLQAHAFSIDSNVSIQVGGAGHTSEETPAPNGGGPVSLGLGIARDAVGAGLSIARGATEASLQTADAVTKASLQTAGSIISSLTRSERRALRGYCAQRPLTRHQQARFNRLPDDWETDVKRNRPLPDEVEEYAIVIPQQKAGLRNRNSASVVLRVENKLILVDGRTDIVIDVMAL